jgi:hypothetical protein
MILAGNGQQRRVAHRPCWGAAFVADTCDPARGSMPQRSLGGRGLQFELDRQECAEWQIKYMSKEA